MMRWGSEEEKHANLWRNALMATGRRGVQWVEDYMEILRGKEWKLPFEDPLRILFYQVVQERATQVNYLNMALIARAGSKPEKFGADADFVLAEVSRKIAVDEAAHYKFFQEIFRLFLYYVPDEAAEAALDVVNHFYMPASDIIPDFNVFVEALRKTSVYGGRQYAVDVLEPAFRSMGIANRKTLEAAVRRSREVPRHARGHEEHRDFRQSRFPPHRGLCEKDLPPHRALRKGRRNRGILQRPVCAERVSGVRRLFGPVPRVSDAALQRKADGWGRPR